MQVRETTPADPEGATRVPHVSEDGRRDAAVDEFERVAETCPDCATSYDPGRTEGRCPVCEGAETTRDGPVGLAYDSCDDWLIFARGEDGSLWCTITEMWPEWTLHPEGADREEGAVERYMLPHVTGWRSDESPTGSVVSLPATGAKPHRLELARWYRAE